MKQKIFTLFQRKLWSPFSGQRGLSVVEILIGSVMLVILSFGFTEFLISVKKSLSGTEKKLGSILWSQYILESLITNPECISPCTTITSSCTNTFTQNAPLTNFEDTTGTEVPFTALYSPSTNTNPPPLQLFVSNTDSNYDPAKHHYSDLYIDTMVFKAGSLATDDRNSEVTLHITFKEVAGSTTALLSRAFSLVAIIDEYQSNDSSSADYKKVQKCHFSGSSTTGEATNCYTVDAEGTQDVLSATEGTKEELNPSTGHARALVGCGGTSAIQKSETTAFGYGAGANTTGIYNTFIGYKAGNSNTSGYNNTFVGWKVGYNNTAGKLNIFIGYMSGFSNTTGTQNIFVGNRAGRFNTTGAFNTFMGRWAGYNNTTGEGNTFVGRWAGYNNTTGEGNTFIGNAIGTTAGGISGSLNNQLNIGNLILGKIPIPSSTPTSTPAVSDLGGAGVVIHGNLIVSGTVKGSSFITTSSRVYKKNIKSFTDFDKSLDDIVNTSLFNYEYKKNHPDKTRMGIISEELPKHLQILDEGSPSRPDWVSIYGTLWAGIKAIVKKMNSFKKEFLLLIKKLEAQFNQAQESYNQTKADLNTTVEKLNKTSENLSKTTTELKETQAELVQTKAELNTTAEKLNKTTEKLNNTTEKLNKTTEKLSNTTEKLNKTTEKLSNTTEKLNKTTIELTGTQQSLLDTQKTLQELKTTLQNQDKRLLKLEKQKQ